jgi:signal peptidase I
LRAPRPVENLVGRVDVVLGSWDLGVARDPIWSWPSGLRLSRFLSCRASSHG